MIISSNQTTLLVVVLLIGREKSLLFIALAYLINLGVTIVIVLYYILLDNLLKIVKDTRIDYIKYRLREQNLATLVFVSIDFIGGSQFLSYIQLLSIKSVLRRVFVDKSYLTFTISNQYPKLIEVRVVYRLKVLTILLTITLLVLLEFELEISIVVQIARYIRVLTIQIKIRYIVQRYKLGKLEE